MRYLFDCTCYARRFISLILYLVVRPQLDLGVFSCRGYRIFGDSLPFLILLYRVRCSNF